MNLQPLDMTRVGAVISRILLPLAVLAFPTLWISSSYRNLLAMQEQQIVFMRHRAATVASRLEVPGGTPHQVESLADLEPALLELVFYSSPEDLPALQPIWNGEELFRTESLHLGGREIFRSYVPFHSAEGLRIARIDLDASAAEFLVSHARHNLIISVAGSLLWLALAAYALHAHRRTAGMAIRQIELEHLANLGKMSSVLAHEIRNPLGTIKGFAQLIGERTRHAHSELLDPILSETERLENLVRDLLLYGRPPMPVPQPTEWSEVRSALLGHACHACLGRKIALEIDDPQVVWNTDTAILVPALLNLLRNAIEAIPAEAEGHLAIRLRTEQPHGLSISITDDGTGLDAGVQSRLFEPFLTTKATGTGLGLAITRKLLESLGGTLEILPRMPRGVEAKVHFAAVHAQTRVRQETRWNAS